MPEVSAQAAREGVQIAIRIISGATEKPKKAAERELLVKRLEAALERLLLLEEGTGEAACRR